MTKEQIYEWEAYTTGDDLVASSFPVLVAKDFTSSDTAIGAASRVAKHLLRNSLIRPWQPMAIDIGDQRFVFHGELVPEVTWVVTVERPPKEDK